MWNFVVYFVSYTIWHVIQFLFHGDGEMRAVILKKYYMSNGLTAIIHNKIPQNFQGSRGKMKT